MAPHTSESATPCAGVQYSAEEIYCSERQQPALISVVSRTGPHAPIRFVLWCSLRGIDDCNEGCLRRRTCPARGARP
jgi:hypothetical protein